VAAATGFPGVEAVDPEAEAGGAGFAVGGAEDGDLFSSGIAQNAPTSGSNFGENVNFYQLGEAVSTSYVTNAAKLFHRETCG
jgi:hypothetical protein